MVSALLLMSFTIGSLRCLQMLWHVFEATVFYGSFWKKMWAET